MVRKSPVQQQLYRNYIKFLKETMGENGRSTQIGNANILEAFATGTKVSSNSGIQIEER